MNDGGNAIEGFNRDENDRLMGKLREAKAPDTWPFVESIKTLDSVYNEPSGILTDGGSVYLLPVDAE